MLVLCLVAPHLILPSSSQWATTPLLCPHTLYTLTAESLNDLWLGGYDLVCMKTKWCFHWSSEQIPKYCAAENLIKLISWCLFTCNAPNTELWNWIVKLVKSKNEMWQIFIWCKRNERRSASINTDDRTGHNFFFLLFYILCVYHV